MILKHVLLCQPDYYRVDYTINPWMKIGSVNLEIAWQQWAELLKVYQELKIKVSIIKQDLECPDMVFTADEALLVSDKNLILAKFKYEQRRAETPYYKNWLIKNGFQLIELKNSANFFEGSGDCLIWKKNNYFIGEGQRSSSNQARYLSELTQQFFRPLELIHPRFFHLDTCLFILNETTAFYFPLAFSAEAVTLLKKSFSNLIAIPESEANNFGLNCITHKSFVLIQEGNSFICNKLISLNYKPIRLNLSEYVKAGGGIHCLTQVLDFEF